jgi:hypothetical protein
MSVLSENYDHKQVADGHPPAIRGSMEPLISVTGVRVYTLINIYPQ